MTRANLSRMLELSEDRLEQKNNVEVDPDVIAKFNHWVENDEDVQAILNVVYSKGVTDGLKCALLLEDGATLEEAATYMATTLNMNS